MGLILDTSVLIDAERKKQTVREMMQHLLFEHPGEFALSSVSLMEFAAGIERAKTDLQRKTRTEFLFDVRTALQIFPFDEEIAISTGLLSGKLQSQGVILGSLDLMIGVTALQAGFSVATRNVRHFRMIPDLNVVEM